MWWQAVLLTLFALALVGASGWLIFRAGWWAGRKDLRQKLGIAGQRRLKVQEMLVNEAYTIMTTTSTDVMEVQVRMKIWAEEYERWAGR